MASVKEKHSLGRHPLLYPEPALLICTYDADGKPNVMTVAWAGICSSEPLALSVSIRPSRWTHTAILARKAFTVGIATESMVAGVDYVGMASGRRADKFPVAGFTPVRAQFVDAPYIAECPVVLECALLQTLDMGSHTMLIATIEDVKVDEACLGPDGMPVMAELSPLLYDAGSNAYYGVGKLVAAAFSVGKPLLKQG